MAPRPDATGMDVTIEGSAVRGVARAPASKSYTHRAILAAGYADGATVAAPLVSADTRATADAVRAFGGRVDAGEDGGDTGQTADLESGAERLEVTGFDGDPGVPPDVIDCRNSGTTMRLVTGTAALTEGLSVLTGDASLRSRPQGPLLDAVEQLGGRAESTRGDGRAPLVIGGPVRGGRAELPGDVSSQFVTSLLMAGAVTPEGIEIDLTTPLKSAPYVDITVEVLAAFGVDARETEAGYAVEGGQSYRAPGATYTVPGDFSSASYLLAAGALAGEEAVRVEGLYPSAQGDAAVVEILERMGADADWDREAGAIAVGRADLEGVTVGVEDTPDLLPTLAVLGAAAGGTTRITDCEHVRYKETDRVRAMAEALRAMGARVEEYEDELVVHGGETTLEGAPLDGRGDHRIVMALSVAALVADGETTIAGAEHVDVSFPGFFEVLSGLGARIERTDASG